MDLTRTAYGIWSGGRFMHFGEPLEDKRFVDAVRHAYESGIRTFVTADVYGTGAADSTLGEALAEFPRSTYCLVGMIGHDFYEGQRAGSKGYPRFTDPQLRSPREFTSYMRMATEKSLERCRTDRFDCLMLHNPDELGYSRDEVWSGMSRLQEEGLTEFLGIAPGPANGYTLDMLLSFERFGSLIDWAMIILNPFEPWPGQLVLPGAVANDIKVLTRVVDYGGIFHGDVKPGHVFAKYDHRTFRPQGWVEAGNQKLQQLAPLMERHKLTPLQLACIWNLSQEPVRSVVPTMIQESGEEAKTIEAKIQELAQLPEATLTADEIAHVSAVGANRNCMDLKGGNPAYNGEAIADRWPLNRDLEAVAKRWHINPVEDLAYAHATPA